MSKSQSNGDLLPYREVDRALKPKLPLLAGLMGVTPQHALGSLLEFWDLCADPRELERVAAAALKRGEEPAVLLPADDVALRFELASGKRVEPLKLVMLGFLEVRAADLYRVRGMSRDFKPIVKRLRAREVAAAGGRASAEARKAATGSAQPKGGKGFKARSEGASDEGVPEPSREPKRNRTDDQSGSEPATEAEPKPSGQRSAVSGLTSSSYEDDGPAAPPSPSLVFFERFQATRQGLGWAREEPPSRDDLDEFFAAVAEALSDTPEGARVALEVATRGYAKDEYWLQRALPWAGFIKQWRRYVRSSLGGDA